MSRPPRRPSVVPARLPSAQSALLAPVPTLLQAALVVGLLVELLLAAPGTFAGRPTAMVDTGTRGVVHSAGHSVAAPAHRTFYLDPHGSDEIGRAHV